jgi:hypothetical protein
MSKKFIKLVLSLTDYVWTHKYPQGKTINVNK